MKDDSETLAKKELIFHIVLVALCCIGLFLTSLLASGKELNFANSSSEVSSKFHSCSSKYRSLHPSFCF